MYTVVAEIRKKTGNCKNSTVSCFVKQQFSLEKNLISCQLQTYIVTLEKINDLSQILKADSKIIQLLETPPLLNLVLLCVILFSLFFFSSHSEKRFSISFCSANTAVRGKSKC